MKKPSKRTQPYRKGKMRPQGPALAAMKRGKPLNAPHPHDAQRKLQKRKKKPRSLYARLKAYGRK